METGKVLEHIKDESEMILVMELDKDLAIRVIETPLANGLFRIWIAIRCGATRSSTHVDIDKALRHCDEKDIDLVIKTLTDESISDLKIKETW